MEWVKFRFGSGSGCMISFTFFIIVTLKSFRTFSVIPQKTFMLTLNPMSLKNMEFLLYVIVSTQQTDNNNNNIR